MKKIDGSVGRNGVNNAADVKLVQQLLNDCKIPGVTIPLLVDGVIGENTISRIEAFQKKVLSMQTPDGRVDPNGKTFAKLVSLGVDTMPAQEMTFSTKGIDFLASVEALATKPYDDQTGKDITNWVKGATIGYGHLISQDEWNDYKDGVSRQQALSLFREDLTDYIKTVQSSVKQNITQHAFDALVIFVFNIGQNAFKDSSVLKLINDPEASTPYENLEQAWKAWDKSQGKVNKGLQNRRQAEWNIYSKDLYQKW